MITQQKMILTLLNGLQNSQGMMMIQFKTLPNSNSTNVLMQTMIAFTHLHPHISRHLTELRSKKRFIVLMTIKLWKFTEVIPQAPTKSLK